MSNLNIWAVDFNEVYRSDLDEARATGCPLDPLVLPAVRAYFRQDEQPPICVIMGEGAANMFRGWKQIGSHWKMIRNADKFIKSLGGVPVIRPRGLYGDVCVLYINNHIVEDYEFEAAPRQVIKAIVGFQSSLSHRVRATIRE